MRSLLLLLAAFVVGAGLSFLLLRDGGQEAEPVPAEAADVDGTPHLLVQYGTLVIRARAPDGSVPPGTEVGYRFRGETRLLYAAGDGTREFADAPVGPLEVMARAPGYEDAVQPRTLIAGVPMEVRLRLVPKP